MDNTKLKRKSKDDVELLAKTRKKAKIEEDLKEKYQDGLAQVDLGLTSLCKQLEQIDKERGEAHHWIELSLKKKKILRDKTDVEIKKLKLSIHNANSKLIRSFVLRKKL